MEEQIDRRREINAGMKRAILQDLQQLLHEHHALVRLFKSALERAKYDLVIKAEKNDHRNTRTHFCPKKRIPKPFFGKNWKHAILGIRRDTGQKQISETHRSYDALQSPLMFSGKRDIFLISK
ncbi:helitron_like_N domain-containing protein [Trichonephila inaurata madagascariensis]|uniref:Helitron_like_N domain-containing protein n=1 Tax=Trichonephila inaurata madagascariensis TaxID=2747483 RepID=A0A8X6YVV2_9ARAC|nr:helitron_like_N domain-containing protein [Trichonephila inaurata madagascariensis]